ncbi:MAG: hypothetical protein ACU88J_07105 [Gammaproteobacteria bacterium]
MNFINCLLDVTDDDSDQGLTEAIKDRARQMAGIDPDEFGCFDSD